MTSTKISTQVKQAAIESVTPTPAFITAFANHPSTQATWAAMQATGQGFMAIYEFEQENRFGRSVAGFTKDVFVSVALPMISLAWLAIYTASVKAVNAAKSPATKDKASKFYLSTLSNFERITNEQKVEQFVADSFDEKEVV